MLYMRAQDQGSKGTRGAVTRHRYLPGVLSYRLVWAVLQAKLKAQGKAVLGLIYDFTHEPYDDGRGFEDIRNDGLQGVPISPTDPHKPGIVFWRNGHLVHRTKNGVEHFDDNCPQERDARRKATA